MNIGVIFSTISVDTCTAGIFDKVIADKDDI